MLFECHLTYDREFGDQIREFAHSGWKYSQIDGDPILGQKVFCYLTTHDNNITNMIEKMNKLQDETQNFGWIRSKVELIIYDTKTGVGV